MVYVDGGMKEEVSFELEVYHYGMSRLNYAINGRSLLLQRSLLIFS
jgi:hypothetical protein